VPACPVCRARCCRASTTRSSALSMTLPRGMHDQC
jgi:hypothetical protein